MSLGRLNSRSKQVTVIGGGFSGLVTACVLSRRGYRVTLHEAGQRVGGLIYSEKTPWGLSEWAAHSVLATQSVEAFMDSLGLLYVDVHPRAKKKWFYRSKKVRQLPLSFSELLGTCVRAATVKAPTHQSDRRPLSVEDWGLRHLGEAATRSILHPMTLGIFAVPPSQLSLEAAFPAWDVLPGQTLLGTLWNRRSRSSGKRGQVMTPLEGMGAWIAAMEEEIKREQVLLLNSSVSSSDLRDLIKDGNVVIATAAREAAQLLEGLDPELAGGLRSIRYTPLMTATAFLKERRGLPAGQGILFAPDENIPCLGILFNSLSFENRTTDPQHSSLTFFFGGTQDPRALSLSDEQVAGRVSEVLMRAFGYRSDLLGLSIHRHPRAIPLYDQGLVQTWELARKNWCSAPGRILLGNYTGQVSLRGIVQQALAL